MALPFSAPSQRIAGCLERPNSIPWKIKRHRSGQAREACSNRCHWVRPQAQGPAQGFCRGVGSGGRLHGQVRFSLAPKRFFEFLLAPPG